MPEHIQEPLTESAPQKAFSMSRDDSIFWTSLAAFGGGLTAMSLFTPLGILLAVVGIAGLVWANRGHMPKPSLRFVTLISVLLITTSVTGYDLYDRHFAKPLKAAIQTTVTNVVLPDGRLSTKLDLRENKPDRKIVIVALHYYGTVDGLDQTGLQKSSLFDYRIGEQTIIIQPDAKFIREAPNYSTNFYLVDLPNGVSETQFSTLRQTFQLGAYLTFLGANGPASCLPNDNRAP